MPGPFFGRIGRFGGPGGIGGGPGLPMPGPNWGMKGYFTLPYEYVLDQNLADDFWTIRTVQ